MTTVVRTTQLLVHAPLQKVFDYVSDLTKHSEWSDGELKIEAVAAVRLPLATFSGWIRHGAQQTTLNNVSGLISQYWGRQLATEWWWLSAHQFDRECIAVKCMVVRSRPILGETKCL